MEEKFKEKNKNSSKSSSTRKKLIIIVITVISLMIALLLISFAIDMYYDSIPEYDMTEQTIDFDFAVPDYNKNIFEDEEYISLTENGFIYYKDEASGVTLGVDKNTASNYGSDVQFMVEHIYSIINGDADKYNSFFSDTYFKKHEKHDLFTMQMLYNVYITKISYEEVFDNEGTYLQYQFSLEYNILDNNGTFRKDIGTGTRKQYFTLSDRNGSLQIDNITVPQIKK